MSTSDNLIQNQQKNPRGHISANVADGANLETLAITPEPFRNGQISVTTVGEIRRIGMDVIPDPTKNNPYHVSIAPQNVPILPEEAEALSNLFKRQANQWKPERKIEMKTIFVDTNSVNENGTLRIHEIIVKNMGLQIGEKVIAYQDSDWWEAEIVFENDNWGVVLNSDTYEVSKERQEGHTEGFWEGYYIQCVGIILVLEKLNYSETEIERIKSKLGIK